jgi:type II secretory pathway pseudopilin PulG
MFAVVIIVGILATTAVAGYRRVIQSSKIAEATNMVGAIKVAQEAFRSETGSYLDVSPHISLNGNHATECYPKEPRPGESAPWGGACTTAQCNTGTSWAMLAVQSDGVVQYGYTTKAGTAGVAIPSEFQMDGGGTSPNGPWFVAAATADLDGNGTYSSVAGTSWSGSLAIINEGE